MIKKILLIVVQFVIFLFLFAAGSFLPVFHFPSVVTKWADGTRGFEWDGVLVMLAFLVLVLLIEALRKRIRSAAPRTMLALILAAAAGLAMKFGFMTLPR